RVFGIKERSKEERIEKTIKATEEFFESIRIPTRLSHVGLNETCIEPIVQRMKERNWSLGENGTI
ncbi:MAG TPA: alcohol dehydrogenase, partial [Bacteroidales bacterium]|nr:alcohol dehydrogenase [Bacteroidales bacterium]